MHPAKIKIANERLSAEVALLGAELQSLTDRDGRPLLWHGDPAWWSGRAPLLFPIVGKLPGDEALIDGRRYTIPKHGFARTSEFRLVSAEAGSCTLELAANAATRTAYPFEFRLVVTHALEGSSLKTTAVIHNDGPTSMPVSFGFHPAFLWPLPDDDDRAGYEIQFEKPEPAPIRRVAGELLVAAPEPTPVRGNRLPLADHLFERGALIFIEHTSRSVTLGGKTAAHLRVDFPDLPHLGIWTKPGAPYVCIEPWQGYAAAADFTGDLADKPGTVAIAPGASREFAMSIRVLRV